MQHAVLTSHELVVVVKAVIVLVVVKVLLV
jgi:hypothetical protein